MSRGKPLSGARRAGEHKRFEWLPGSPMCYLVLQCVTFPSRRVAIIRRDAARSDESFRPSISEAHRGYRNSMFVKRICKRRRACAAHRDLVEPAAVDPVAPYDRVASGMFLKDSGNI